MPETHIVLRPFEAGGRLLDPGERVDGSNWPNAPLLIAQGQLRELRPDEVEPEKKKAAPAKPKARR